MPEMQKQTIRFGRGLWTWIEEEARVDGTSSAQLVRDAALAYVAYRRAMRGDEIGEAIVSAIRQESAEAEARRQHAAQAVLRWARPQLLETLRALDDHDPEARRYFTELYGIDANAL